jgi:hypothetical protein
MMKTLRVKKKRRNNEAGGQHRTSCERPIQLKKKAAGVQAIGTVDVRRELYE